MKIAIALLACVMLATVQSTDCPTFTCKKPTQPPTGDTKNCGGPKAANSTDVIAQNICDSEQVCDAPKGLDFGPSAVPNTFQKKNATCVNATQTTYTKSWPGQSCGEVGKEKINVDCDEGSECTDNVCKAKAGAAEAACTDSGYCDVGLYCMPGDDPKCTAMLDDKADCDLNGATDQCGLGSLCVQAGDAKNATCMAFGSVNPGTELKSWNNGDQGTYNLICKGGNILKSGTADTPTYWCMHPTTNEADITEGQDSGYICKTKTYVTTDAPDNVTESSHTTKCGFNEGPKSYCPAQLGDEKVAASISSMVTTWTAKRTTCPNGGNILLCTEWSDEDESTVGSYNKWTSLVTSEQGWPNVANNAACIKDTYTRWFYGNAATAGFAVVFAALSIVF